jgi:uracil phosphoribosyltransferase
MKGVTIVSHPLVQHKLTLMRKKDTSTKSFRQLLKEVAALICYEVTRDLPLEMVDIETPLMAMQAPQLAGKKLVFAPVLRSGMGMLDGMLELAPAARIAHIGLYRDPATLACVEYYFWRPATPPSPLSIGCWRPERNRSAWPACWPRRRASPSSRATTRT